MGRPAGTAPTSGITAAGAGRCAPDKAEKGARRILVTGSRDWTDERIIRSALSLALRDLGEPTNAVLVQGECHLGGADKIAADTWRGWGYPVEGHPAERDVNGRVLGPERNARMVALGADLCLAFPLPSSRGTKNCMRLAREAGIPVRVYEEVPHG